MLKLFVAVILQGYNDIKLREERLFNDKIHENYIEAWKDYDPEATGLIPASSLKEFLKQLGEPLGINKETGMDSEACEKFIESIEVEAANE